MIKILITGVAVTLISSCAQTEYTDVKSSGIKHSSPEVISLYEYENEKLRRENNSGGFSWLLDGLLGSDPDDDYDDHHHHGHRNDSPKRKKQFISKNGETLRSKLEEKKR